MDEESLETRLLTENRDVTSEIVRTFIWVSQVNGVNVVKVGHKQVVSLIRQGGSSLLMKVVSVTRKPETEDVVRKKGESNYCWTC